jgi:hypothetical protein
MEPVVRKAFTMRPTSVSVKPVLTMNAVKNLSANASPIL